jgi:hypothetical protein
VCRRGQALVNGTTSSISEVFSTTGAARHFWGEVIP